MSIIRKYNLSFDESLYTYEDLIFSIEYLCKAGGSCYINSTPVYRQYVNPKSTSQNIFSRINNKSLSTLKAWIRLKELIYDSKCPMTTKYLSKLMLIRHYILLVDVVDSNTEISLEKKRIIKQELAQQIQSHVGYFDFIVYQLRELVKKILSILRINSVKQKR